MAYCCVYQTGVNPVAYSVASNVISAVGGAVVGGIVAGGLTTLSGGAGAPIAAAAGFYTGYLVADSISNAMDSLGRKLFDSKN